jgi:hypothetical protein
MRPRRGDVLHAAIHKFQPAVAAQHVYLDGE